MIRYYSTQRPVMPGSYPKSANVENIVNFDEKKFCEEIGRSAWGYIEYSEKLPEHDAEAYELTAGASKMYYCVTSSFDSKGRVIAAVTSAQECSKKPENQFIHTTEKDIYIDWFDDQEEAKRYVEEAMAV